MTASVPHSDTYEASWPRLFAVAYQMTGSAADAEDIVHDAWNRRLERPTLDVRSEIGWLYRTVSHLAIDHLRRSARTVGVYPGEWLPEPVADDRLTPESVALERESVSMALLLMLEHLTPEQRVVWVLRSALAYSFAEIGAAIGKHEVACRQIHRRARLRLEAAGIDRIRPVSGALLDAFTGAMESGDPARVAALLADDAIWIGDGGGIRSTIRRPVVGADRVARGLLGVTSKFIDGAMRLESRSINGAPAIVVWNGVEIDTLQMFLTDGVRITHALSMRNPEKLRFV